MTETDSLDANSTAGRAPAQTGFWEGLLGQIWPYALCAGAGFILHLTLALPIYQWYDRVAAWLLLVNFLVISYRFFTAGVRAVPVLPILAANFYIFYGLAQFTQEGLDLVSGYYSPSARAVTLASWLSVFGELSLLAGYWVVTRCTRRMGNIFDIILPVPDRTWKVASLLYALPSIGIYMLVALFPENLPIELRYPLTMVFNAYLAVALLFYLGYGHKLWMCKIAGWLMILLMASAAMIQGMLEPVLAPIVESAISYLIWGGPLRLKWLIVPVLMLLALNPVKHRYRELSWQGKAVSAPDKVWQRLNDWSRAFSDVWFSSAGPTKEDNMKTTTSRISDLPALELMTDLVPDVVPFDHERSLGVGALYWIPRVLWPSKPPSADLLYNRYAVTFGFTTLEGLEYTTAGASPCVEGYWNHGILGVFAFTGMIGILLGILLGNSRPPMGVSVLASLAYLGPSPLQTPVALAIALPGAVTFAVGITLAMWTLAAMAVVTRRGQAR